MSKVYFACLRAYNEGVLHGRWVEITDADEMNQEIREMLDESPVADAFRVVDSDRDTVTTDDYGGEWVSKDRAEEIAALDDSWVVESNCEEWAAHDYDDCPGFGEHPDLDKLAEYAAGYEEHGKPFAVYWKWQDDGYQSADDFSERYRGYYKSEVDFVQDLLDETGEINEIPERLRFYFDYEKYANDLRLGGDVSYVWKDGDCYVFWNS